MAWVPFSFRDLCYSLIITCNPELHNTSDVCCVLEFVFPIRSKLSSHKIYPYVYLILISRLSAVKVLPGPHIERPEVGLIHDCLFFFDGRCF